MVLAVYTLILLVIYISRKPNSLEEINLLPLILEHRFATV